MQRSHWQNTVFVLVLAGAIAAIYVPALRAPFVFDDRVSVEENSSIERLFPLIADLPRGGPLNPPRDLPTSGRPLVNLSLAVNYCIGGRNPAGYHAFNIALHLLSALLLAAIVRRTLRLEYFSGRYDTSADAIAWLAALLWAVHPLATEAVIYVTQRTELLVSFFYLATLYGALRYWTGAARCLWAAVSITACAAGMTCKEVMVTAPLVVLLYERTFIAGSFWRAAMRSWPLYLGLALTWGILAYLNFDTPRSLSAGFDLGVPAYAWWLTQAKVLVSYLKLAIWPHPLLIHYEMPYFVSFPRAWPWVVAVAVVFFATVFLVWRRTSAGFLLAVLFLILSPTLVIPIITEVAAERRMYLPLAAIGCLFAVAVWRVIDSVSGRSGRATSAHSTLSLAAACLPLILLAGFASHKRATAYCDPMSLWTEVLQHQPDDAIAHSTIGILLIAAGRTDEAITHFNESVRLLPDYADAHNNLSALLFRQGRIEESIEHSRRALESKPGNPKTHLNLANALVVTGHLEEGLAEYAEALRLDPDYADVHFNLGSVYWELGRMPESLDHFQKTVAIKPDYVDAWFSLARADAQLQHTGDAVAAAQRAIEIATSGGQTAQADKIRNWLESYRASLTNKLQPDK